MFTKGEFSIDGVTYGALVSHTKQRTEVLLVTSGTVVSAYKSDSEGSYSYNNVRAKELAKILQTGIKGCTSKNCTPQPFVLGAMNMHEFKKSKTDYIISLHRGELVGAYIQSGNARVELDYIPEMQFPDNIPYVKLTEIKKDIEIVEDELDNVKVRSVQEIALEKEDVTWLQNKKYYVVNDDETAEKLFQFLENYNGAIAYDTETTGLRINCFGKIGSEYMDKLDKYNEEHQSEKIRADRLVGIIFCVENDVSYYFPCFNRKFKNLYQDLDSPVRIRTVNNIKARYTVGDLKDSDGDMARYVRNTKPEDFRLDVILMERCRDILQTRHLVGHNGSFEWRVGWLFDIDTNMKDDTMILHQLMYKFRSTTRNSGESSSLKYLAKRELGVDQWELSDFFPSFKEDKAGTVRTKAGTKKKSGSKIDFSYMDYEGTRVYAPTDGDVTFQLFNLYKRDLVTNFPELEYIYSVEMIVSLAIAYMEFYGHRIDETKIMNAREQTKADLAMIESEIRQVINYSDEKELTAYNILKDTRAKLAELEKLEGVDNKDEIKRIEESLPELTKNLSDAITSNETNVLNLSAPGQVAELFYDKLEYPVQGDKRSVAKNALKPLLKERDDEGNMKYPVVKMYSDYKNKETQLTKFFDNLPYFMYPGGIIFSSYGQISTATGRMSCIEENTSILTVGGEKKIKDIKAGDLVYSYDDNGNIKISKVISLIDQGVKDCIELDWVSVGNGNTGKLVCTPDHKILTDNGWVRADSLNVKDKVYHLHRSNEDRPRLFGSNSFSEQEQLIIKKELFGVSGYNNVIHHLDVDTTNNDISNLEVTSRSEHSRLHGKERAKNGDIKYEHLQDCSRIVLNGDLHPNYKDISEEELIDMLIEAGGIVSNLPIDYTTFVRKCEMFDIDYMELSNKIRGINTVTDDEIIDAFNKTSGSVFAVASELGIGRVQAENRLIKLGLIKEKERTVDIGISDDEFIKNFFDAEGSIRKTASLSGITFYKAKLKIKELGLCYNHRITGKRTCGKKHVYDISVEGPHNFIANEICVHNCSKPNAQQYPKLITKIVIPRDGYVMIDADYSQIEYRVLTALAKNTELAKLFADPDSDYHTMMASLMYDVPYASVTPAMRSAAKSFNFGIPYGMGLGSLAILLTGKNTPQTRDEAAEKLEAYYKNQPRTRRLFDDIKEMAQINGYTKTLFNRYRYYTFTDKDGNVNNAKRAAALRQAGNAVIQGTAADIFKIGVARNFNYIRNNHLLGKLLIVNMVHDEQLMEIDARCLNVQRILADVGKNMQFNIDGFPPLYIGAGVSDSWGTAKGKMKEIHPVLLDNFTREADNIPIFRDSGDIGDPKKVIEYFDSRVYEFRRNKVAEYLSNPENWHKDIHPAIGSLINLQFNYGRGDDAKVYVGPNGETYSDQEFLELNIADFLNENNIQAEPSWFKMNDTIAQQKEELEEEEDYTDDDEDEESDDLLSEYDDIKTFSVVDESNKLFGSSIQDMIGIFGAVLLTPQKICGIDTRNLYYKQKDAIIEYLMNYICDPDDPDGLQIVFLNDTNVLNYTGQYVKGIRTSDFETQYKTMLALNKNSSDNDSYLEGDIHTRSQAK